MYPPAVDFSPIVRERAARDPKFRRALLCEALDCLMDGELSTGRILLRDYINATMGFERLAVRTEIPSKSLIRMFGPKGNPTARHLFTVLVQLQRAERVRLHATTSARLARRLRRAS